MNRRLRTVKSEISARFIKNRVKTERTKTALRFSRRLRHLPPEYIAYFDNIRSRLKKEKLEGKQVISQESSIQFPQGHKKGRSRKLNYPQRVKNSKEVISILSAPKICSTRAFLSKKLTEISMQVRGSSCKPKIMVKSQGGSRSQYIPSKYHINVKREASPGTEKILHNRKKYVLEVLNRGDMKDIEKLPTVGSKTAERIILYRQLKGSINRISELAKMPKFPKKMFHNFVAQNFLKVD